jgi:mono/diheme cytochrome c family protein
MRSVVLVGGVLMLTITGVAVAASRADQVAHGRYLVHQVAMCVQCHTPRDANGELDRTRLLKGAPVPVRSPVPTQQWAVSAPAIAGLPGFSDEDEITLLTTGHRPGSPVPKPPMPPFRLTREDAEAVVAYLRSLP